MPELSAFPMSHQVTFKYYVGVILFLEENYVQVCRQWLVKIFGVLANKLHRQRKTSLKPGSCVTIAQSEIKSEYFLDPYRPGHTPLKITLYS